MPAAGTCSFPPRKRTIPRVCGAPRKFESIPDSITQDLGLTCPITPVMEGNEFFLEIDVPAAQEPLALHGVYWLYEDGVNTRQTYESISRSWRDEATTPWELKTLPYVEDEDLSGEALSPSRASRFPTWTQPAEP